MSLPGEKLIDALYRDRERYTIVGLTGYADSGCTRLAELMCKKFEDWEGLRKPEHIKIEVPKVLCNDDLIFTGNTNHGSISTNVFARKYTICHNFAKAKYLPFTVLKYSRALLFYILKFLIEHEGIKSSYSLKTNIKSIIEDKFRPLSEVEDLYYKKKPKKSLIIDFDRIHIDWEALYTDFSSLFGNPAEENKADMARIFFDENSSFHNFAVTLSTSMWETDAYCTAMFFHNLGFVVRATGDPTFSANEVISSNKIYGENLYVVVELINDIIKSYRKWNPRGDKQTRIVIDKIRNSLEAKFLKERYSAFYLIAVHDDLSSEKHLISRLESCYTTQEELARNKEIIAIQEKLMVQIDSIEREGKNFENGKFFSPNLSQCVADAEIHISNTSESGNEMPVFYTMSEQWMKYATLIQHPGLITPSSEERCMVVAYTAKFNSGCLSRQVGAVITNKAHTIRTIGWNDVPYGQLPCSLRELDVMAHEKNDSNGTRSYVYSDYEKNETKLYRDRTFVDFVRLKYQNLHLTGNKNELMKGFPYSYCFKNLQNEFEGVKNQVHTRSLHAEENAILQMAKYGGEALNEGVIYVTASPCELCCKKLYQIGVRKIIYIDEYPGISRENIINNGYHRPKLKQFQGAYGATYFKLYQPIIPYKEELFLRNLTEFKTKQQPFNDKDKLRALSDILGIDLTGDIKSEEELKDMMEKVHSLRIKKEKDAPEKL